MVTWKHLVVALALIASSGAHAIQVNGVFAAGTKQVNGDDVAAAPYFDLFTTFTGSFSYDTSGAVDLDPDPVKGSYVFSNGAFLSLSTGAYTFTTDPTLGPLTVALSVFSGNYSLRITGLVNQADVPLATSDVEIALTLVNGFDTIPFQPTDALPTTTFALSKFSDPDGRIDPGSVATPYDIFLTLNSLTIASIPAPGALGLLGMGALALVRRRRS